MNRKKAHNKWVNPHYDHIDFMANHYKIQLMGKLSSCDGCGLIKSRVKATTRSYNKRKKENGERLFVDKIGPYPKSRGGMKYWICAADDKSDKTWSPRA